MDNDRLKHSYLWHLAAAVTCLVLAVVIYLPGLSGPYVFDDTPNLLINDYIKLNHLSPDSLYQAGYSLKAGPLQRPISMISFALNYYFAGSFDDSTPYKITNVAVHAANGMLVYWFIYLILLRLALNRNGGWDRLRHSPRKLVALSAGIALLWTVHPIQLTSVLYVVQRMVSLSALFTLMGLICYLKGRQRMIDGRSHGVSLILLGILGCGTLGALSKENAVLIIPLALILEIALFRNAAPLSYWQRLSARQQHISIALLGLFSAAALAWFIHYTIPGYSTRTFSMSERMLTETRVMWFYLSLILLPQLDRYGLNHDDIALSTSLLTPWTTLPAVLGIMALLAIGFLAWKRHPLFGFGVLWFFIGHVLESSFIALELVHEHRNYLPSLGILLAMADVLNALACKLKFSRLWALVPVLVLTFAAVTAIRSTQWSDMYTFARFEVLHHPESARAHGYMGWVMGQHREYAAALEQMRLAAQLNPDESVYLINMHIISAQSGIPLTTHERAEAVNRLVHGGLTGSTLLALQTLDKCLSIHCQGMLPVVESWTRTVLNESTTNIDRSYYYYLLGRSLSGQGRYDEAIEALRQASDLDPHYLHPLFEIAQIDIVRHDLLKAERTLAELRKANNNAPYRRDSDIELLARHIEELKYLSKNNTNG